MPASLPEGVRGIVDGALAQLDNAIHVVGEEQIAAYIYAAYVKLDVPYVPESVEATVFDPIMEHVIQHFVKRIHDRVHRDPPAPPAVLPPKETGPGA